MTDKNQQLIDESVKRFNREVDRLTARLSSLGFDLDAHAQDSDDEDHAAQFESDVKKLRLQKLGRK